MLFEVVDREGGLLRVKGGEGVFVAMVLGSVFREELGLAVSLVMRVGESEVDEEGLLGFLGLAATEVVENLLAVPVGAGFIGAAAFGSVFDNFKFLVCQRVAVSPLAGAHGLITGLIENSREGLRGGLSCAVLLIGRVSFLFFWNFPDALTGHDHRPRARADRSAP